MAVIHAEGWWFETERFRSAPETEQEVNPGRYGEGLARWMAQELASRGYDVVEAFAEDWGWSVLLRRDECRLYVNCGNEDGTTVRWHVFPEARVGFLRRVLKGFDAGPLVHQLDADLEAVIRADAATTWCGREQPEAPPADPWPARTAP